MQLRDGQMKPTLRALPGQTFEDGSPVNEDLNVQAPKEKGSSAHGSRLDYPDGTYFASTHLQLVTKMSGTQFYTVYDDPDITANKDPEFYPVSDDPGFNYLMSSHRNDAMNIAFLKFKTFGEQTADEPQPATKNKKPTRKNNMKKTAADAKGRANPMDASWTQSYDEQIENETALIVLWMRKLLTDKNIRMMVVRPKSDPEIREVVKGLLSAGEGVSTITSRPRFERICREQKIDELGLQNIAKGPLRWYLDELTSEHTGKKECTAQPFDIASGLDDAILIVTNNVNNVFGLTETPTADDHANLRKALEDGWTLDDIINPEITTQKSSVSELCAALASGEIPMPAGNSTGQSFLDTLLANKKNKKPSDKDGFHVDDVVWSLMMRNLHRKKNTLIFGETGTGKTELVRLLCERTGTPLTIIPMGGITDPTEQLVGKMDLDPATGGTRFDWADFANAIQRPGVVLLDEINRCPRNGYNILFSVLDGTATLVASGAKSTDQRNIKVNPECVFFATANIGSRYVGADEMDAALVNRFLPVELEYLSVKAETTILCKRTGIDEQDANNIALVAHNIRQSFNNELLQHCVSTRETIECASLVADGFDIQTAMELTFLPSFERGATENDPNCERGKVRAMIATRFAS